MKKIISFVVFISLLLCLIYGATEILTPKIQNRYYMLEDYLKKHPEENLHDVQIFGSCHAYTSFNPVYMEERSGVSSFVYANAGEILPTTYVRMVEQFKKHTPKVALVETWGINPYETYITQDSVFGYYLANNLELTDFSLAKQEVILDFQDKKYEDINLLSMNFPFMNYKDRLLDNSLTPLDFDFDFAKARNHISRYNYNEMVSRLKNNGFKVYDSVMIKDYPQKQSKIEPDEFLEIEPDIVKYIQKIIDLCKEKNVELIFYRSPYISTANELKKVNHMKQICDENNVLFLDLEKEISYNYNVDFFDYEHLSEIGANKATEFLIPYILDALNETVEKKELVSENLLKNSDFSDNGSWGSYLGKTYVTENGKTIELTNRTSGWILYQNVDVPETSWGTSVTAYFNISNCDGTFLLPVISYFDENQNEISYTKYELTPGKFTFSGCIPVGTKFIRVGLFANAGSAAGNFATVKNVQLFHGAFSLNTLPQ